MTTTQNMIPLCRACGPSVWPSATLDATGQQCCRCTAQAIYLIPETSLSAYLGLERLAEEADGRPSADLRARLNAAWKALTPAEVAWLRARQSSGGPFEDAARRRKVLKLLAFVPMAGSAAENEVTAAWLARMSVPERGIFAKVASCNAPSDESWRQLIEAVKARKTVDEVDALAREIIK